MSSRSCPMCGNPIRGHPALSRDNIHEICSQCGQLEAVADMSPHKDLPRHCYYTNINGSTVMIMRGATGYWNLSPGYSKTSASELNSRWGVSDADADKMVGYSMWGWPKKANSQKNTRSSSEPAYTGPYTSETLWGHKIIAAYYDPYIERFNVIAYRKDLGPGVIIGKGYDPNKGMWGGGVYDLTMDQARNTIAGRCVWDTSGLSVPEDVPKRPPSTRPRSQSNVRPKPKQSAKPSQARKPASRNAPTKKTTPVKKSGAGKRC